MSDNKSFILFKDCLRYILIINIRFSRISFSVFGKLLKKSIFANEMKKEYTAIFFYVLYVLAMMRPITPIIEYYSNYEYIATVLCENRDKPALACQGKCYFEKEMSKAIQSASNDSHKDHESVPRIDFSKYPVAPISVNKIVLKNRSLPNQNIWYTPSGDTSTSISLVFRPPLYQL